MYGELLGAAQRLVEQLGDLDPVTRRFLAAAADTAASRWKEKDQGIWEIRRAARFTLADLLLLDGDSALQEQWTAHVREQWAAAARRRPKRARTTAPGLTAMLPKPSPAMRPWPRS